MSKSKVTIAQVADVIKKNKIDATKARQIIEELNLLLGAEDDGEEKEPTVKKQFVILVSDPEGKIKGDFAGWVLQIPENEAPATTEDRIRKAAAEFNTTKKGRLLPVKTVGEALENVSGKHFKTAEVWVKTKTPVLVLTTNNELPSVPAE